MAQTDYGDQMPALTDHDIERIAERAADRVVQRMGPWVEPAQHQDDHAWTAGKREAEKANKDSVRRIVEKIIGGAGLVGLVGLFGFVGHAVVSFVMSIVEKGLP